MEICQQSIEFLKVSFGSSWEKTQTHMDSDNGFILSLLIKSQLKLKLEFINLEKFTHFIVMAWNPLSENHWNPMNGIKKDKKLFITMTQP